MNILSRFIASNQRYRWVVWSLLVATYMISFFHRMSVSVVKETLTANFGLSATEFGAMASMYFYAYCIAQIPVGMLADSVGVRITAAISVAVAACGTIAFGCASSPAMLYVSRFLVGLGVAASFVSVMKVQSEWFREREFSTLSGACLFLGNIGSLSAQVPLALLVATLSFRGAFTAIGLGTLALAGLCLVFVRNRPQDIGLAPVSAASRPEGEKAPLGVSLSRVLKNKRLLFLYVFYFFSIPQFLGFGGAWSTAYIRDVYALDLTASSNLASLQIIGFMLGSLALGYLSDKTGKRKPFLVIPCLGTALLWAILAMAGGRSLPPVVFGVCLAALGFCSGMYSVMMAACKESSPPESTGTAIAAINTFGFLGIALATPAYGYIMDRFMEMDHATQHHYATIFIAIITGISLIVSLCCKETGGRNIYGKG
jgi:sugar phosphate permease